jgi:hypothetical protein
MRSGSSRKGGNVRNKSLLMVVIVGAMLTMSDMPPVREHHDKKLQEARKIRNQLTLAFLIVNALLTMGAKLSEVPIEDFSSVAGTWEGIAKFRSTVSWSAPIVIVIEEDSSYRENDTWRPTEGIMRIVDGKIQYDSVDGQIVTITLHEGSGKRLLKAKVEDGSSWKARPAKKKRNKKKKKKKKKNQTSEKKEY